MKHLNIARTAKQTNRDKDRTRYESLQRQHTYCLNNAAHWQAEGYADIAANWTRDAEKVAKKIVKMAEMFDNA
jgi:hypothetical protein